MATQVSKSEKSRSNLDTVGGASSLLGLSYRDQITIDFTNDKKPEFTPIS